MKPSDLQIQQLRILRDERGPRVVSKSEGLPFALEEAALRMSVLFGARPQNVACPFALFAYPIGNSHVAVVQVAEQTNSALGFHFLILTKLLYRELGDPFAIAERYPADWQAASVSELIWPPEPLPPRKVEQLDEMMKHADGPLLYSLTQALLDGARVILPRGQPETRTLRELWQLLPNRSRVELWPCTFAFSAELGFSVAALPQVPKPLPSGTISDEQVLNYPNGNYELALQIAIESRNQHELDRLLTRRTSSEILRLAVTALVVALVLVFASRWIMG